MLLLDMKPEEKINQKEYYNRNNAWLKLDIISSFSAISGLILGIISRELDFINGDFDINKE